LWRRLNKPQRNADENICYGGNVTLPVDKEVSGTTWVVCVRQPGVIDYTEAAVDDAVTSVAAAQHSADGRRDSRQTRLTASYLQPTSISLSYFLDAGGTNSFITSLKLTVTDVYAPQYRVATVLIFAKLRKFKSPNAIDPRSQ